MLSNKSYLIQAFYQWIVDSGCTPIIVVDAAGIEQNILEQCVEGGEVVFNISPEAVRELTISYESLSFKATFTGLAQMVVMPIAAVLAIYAEENQEGMYFNYEDELKSEDDPKLLNPKKTRPILRIVE
jgi:stringent starvation protein B